MVATTRALAQKGPDLGEGFAGLSASARFSLSSLWYASIEAVDLDTDTDTPDEGGFDEIWLADYTQVEAFGALDLFAIVHPELKGHFATGNWGQKPYG